MSDIDICNLALSLMGDRNTIENIDDPQKQEEKIMAKWYNVTRKNTLRRVMPSFAIARELWAKSDKIPAFGYKNAYEYHSDCLKILGIGNITNRVNNYSVEGKYLLCDAEYKEGLPVRYIRDVTNTDEYTSDFTELLAYELASVTCNEITANHNTTNYMLSMVQRKRIELSGVDAQENKPIRISESRFNRTGYYYEGKK